jgi:hypothetical protein
MICLPGPAQGKRLTRVRVAINLTVHGIGPTVRELDPGEDETWVGIERDTCLHQRRRSSQAIGLAAAPHQPPP